MSNRGTRWGSRLLVCVAGLAAAASVGYSQSRTYTLDADFDEGILLNLNHTVVNDQLQLNQATEPFPFINIACSESRGTIVRIDTRTGVIVGEYWAQPEGQPRNPSRTTVDQNGNVWSSSRDNAGGVSYNNSGSVTSGAIVKIGLIVGGTRVRKNGDGTTTPDPNGEYLQPPFSYNTCIDRDGDGLIRTSRGLGNVLRWINVTDATGGVSPTQLALGPALVEDAQDEAILIYQRLPDAPNARHVSVDANNNVWVGGYPFAQRRYYRLNGNDGSCSAAGLDTFNAASFGAGGYGGLVDPNGILWSASISQNNTLKYNPATGTASVVSFPQPYGMGIDTNGFIWNATWTDNRIAKINPTTNAFTLFSTGGSCCRGVAITPTDNNVWVANSCSNNVSRLSNAGAVRKIIPVGDHPTGVSIDGLGKVWVTNYNSGTAMRIDPAGGGDGLGAVDLTVNLNFPGHISGQQAGTPYNYSDMTGIVTIGSTAPQGTWTVVYDSGAAGTVWGTASWNDFIPPGANPTSVQVRAADSQASLPAQVYKNTVNGVSFQPENVVGRFIEIRTTLSRGTSSISPILYDLTISAVAALAIDISPNRVPNKIFLGRPYTIYVAVLGTPTFDPMTIDPASVTFGPTGNEATPVRMPIFYDIDRDGDLDAIYGFLTQRCNFSLTDTTGTLRCMTTGGQALSASDTVAVSP